MSQMNPKNLSTILHIHCRSLPLKQYVVLGEGYIVDKQRDIGTDKQTPRQADNREIDRTTNIHTFIRLMDNKKIRQQTKNGKTLLFVLE